VLRCARAERWRTGELPLADAAVEVDTEDAARVCAPGVTDVVGAGATLGVATVGTFAGGEVGGLAAGTVAAGGGVLAPGTVTDTGETAGVVLAVAARLGNESTANRTSNATVSSAPTRIGRRTASGMRLKAAIRWSLGFPSQILNPMSLPLPPRIIGGVVALPLNTLV
jgi:hypothetical protein